jgi:hypothetical protein
MFSMAKCEMGIFSKIILRIIPMKLLLTTARNKEEILWVWKQSQEGVPGNEPFP